MNRQLEAAARQKAAADKVAQGRLLADALVAITEIHRQEFPTTTSPVAPSPAALDEVKIRLAHRQAAKKQTNIFARTARKAALVAADNEANAEIAAAVEHGRDQQARHQEELNA